MTIEFVSAFGPTVLLSYAEATEKRKPRSRSPAWNGPPVTRRRLKCVRLIESKEDEVAKRAKIRALNDDFRRTFRGGRVMITAGVNALTHTVQRAVFQKIQAFDAFDDERDPWDNHGFVSVEHDGQTFFAKIDYYNRDLTAHSKDATDPQKTCRVMTIMLAEEY